MKVKVDYSLKLRGYTLQPISTKQDSDFYYATYKLNDYYIEVSTSKSNNDSHNGIVYKNKQYKDANQTDGENVIVTNFLVTEVELLQELETCMLLIEKKIPSYRVFGEISVNQARFAVFRNFM